MVDTHVLRVARQLGWASGRGGAEATRRQLERWVPRGTWADFTTAVVGFGQLVQSGVVERGGRGAFKGLVDVLAEFCISSLVIIYYPLGAAWRGVALRVHGVHRARLWSGLDAGRDRR